MKFKFNSLVCLDNGQQIVIENFAVEKLGNKTIFTASLENNNIIESFNITEQYFEKNNVSVFDVSIKLVTTTCRYSNGLASEHGIIINMELKEEISNILANHHFNFWWTKPVFLTSPDQIPKQSVSLCMKQMKPLPAYFYVLPVSGKTSRTQVEGASNNILSFDLSNYTKGTSELNDFAFAIGEGQDIYKTIKATFQTSAKHHPMKPLLREQKCYPALFDKLGWCSWNAFYTAVNADGIVAKADEFLEKNIPVKWMLIDDGWLSIEKDALTSFNEDPKKFPDGFSSLIETLHKEKNIEDVGVWHTLAGHWGGISPSSKLALEEQQHLIKNTRNQLLPHYNADTGFGFWNNWYQKLRNDGISFVKVDGQSAIQNHYKDISPKGIGEVSYGLHRGLEGAVSSYFDGNLINCMGMSSENMWSRTSSSIVRTSDDFIPNSNEGFGKHALQNVYNSLYHGQMYYCDWDMYLTDHFDVKRHSLLRAISGGPVYFSDKVGKTFLEVIKPLVYLDGTITRCDEVGLPAEQNLWENPEETGILKVINRVKENGIMAMFNLTVGRQENDVCFSEMILDDKEYIVYDYFKQKVCTKSHRSYSMDGFGVGLLIFIPRQKLMTPIGLINKYISVHSILSKNEFPSCYTVTLKESGAFGFVSTQEPIEVFCGTIEVTHLMVKKEDHFVLNLPEENREVSLIFKF